MSDEALTTQQIIVIDALSDGVSSTDAAAQAGVHRNTIANWRRNSLFFRESLADAQYDRALLFRDQTEQRLDRALETIDAVLADPKASASARLKAALFIIGKAVTPPPPRKQVPIDIAVPVSQPEIVHEVHKDAQSAAPATPEAEPTTPENPPAVHNNAQNAQSPIRREAPKVGRNQACPCGGALWAGLKYKRCCLDQPNTNARAA